MNFVVLDPTEFLENNLLREDQFLTRVASFDWEQFRQKKVLVRGCNSALFPPWAFMVIAGRLKGIAQSVRYGNEHDNIVVFRETK